MADSWEYLRVETMDDELIVSLPCCELQRHLLQERENWPQLSRKEHPYDGRYCVRRFNCRTPSVTPGRLPTGTARELGWIV